MKDLLEDCVCSYLDEDKGLELFRDDLSDIIDALFEYHQDRSEDLCWLGLLRHGYK